ncbi:MAG: hypothetical protein PHC66_03995 [Candidatus Nanoarchaeia archaeon]|nr:hypothetical protein [Candidatus Nanoarchaeia archaeon]MDD5239342.1 hypothetical protein [Candidatus Nanoarchaeia archaeon]
MPADPKFKIPAELDADNLESVLKSLGNAKSLHTKKRELDYYYPRIESTLEIVFPKRVDAQAGQQKHNQLLNEYRTGLKYDITKFTEMEIENSNHVIDVAYYAGYESALRNLLSYVKTRLFDEFTTKKSLNDENLNRSKAVYFIAGKDRTGNLDYMCVTEDFVNPKNSSLSKLNKEVFEREIKKENIDLLSERGVNAYVVATKSKVLPISEVAAIMKDMLKLKFEQHHPVYNIFLDEEGDIKEEIETEETAELGPQGPNPPEHMAPEPVEPEPLACKRKWDFGYVN